MISFTHQRTAKRMLDIEWNFPKSLEIEADDGQTRAAARMIALPRDEAFRQISEGDQRPLLVLRECGACKGTENALLDLKLDNEKTKLLTRWFRCVKLRPNVVEDNHTYHALFSEANPPHLFLSMPDGSDLIPLDGQQSQSLLWKQMNMVLRKAYEKDPDDAVKALFRVMARFDALDSQESNLREQLEGAVEKSGPESSRVRSLQAKLAKLRKERERAEALEEEAADLRLKAE